MEPGEQGWPYCDLTVNTELVSSLAERWPKAEKMFVMMFCDVFRSLRQERDYIHHYIYNKRLCIYLTHSFIYLLTHSSI